MATTRNVEICIASIPSFVLGRIVAGLPSSYHVAQGERGNQNYLALDVELTIEGLSENKLAEIVVLVDTNSNDYTLQHI